jgi:FkbM family methyltransferase
MRLGNMIRKQLKRMINTHIHRTVPHGVDFIEDITKLLPMYDGKTVFDVGANIGQSARFFLDKFPHSHIYCFEPVSSTFRQLQRNMKGVERVHCYQFAFGSQKRAVKMVLQDRSTRCFVLEQPEELANKDLTTESVDQITLDEFCQMNEIDHISFLKIDTEGGDLEVLKGAAGLLNRQKVELVQVEAGMNPANHRHISFESLKTFLESHGYFLFGIYEQKNEWPTKEPHLRRTNPIFISQKAIEENRMLQA